MPFVLIDGFEDLSSWTVAGATTSTATGARHGNALSLSGGGATATFFIPAAQESATVTVGGAFKFSGSSANLISLCSDAAATDHIDVFLNPSAGLDVKRGATVLASTAAGSFPNGVWKYVEFQATLSDTVGSFTLRVDGVQVAAGTAQDTKNAGTKTTFDSVRLTDTGGAGTPLTLVDDLYIMAGTSDSFQGDSIVETLYPNGNGAVNAWVGSDADSVNNYLLVDEVGAPVTTDYTGSPTPAAQDLYTMTDLVTVGTVLGVCHQAYATKTDTGGKQFKLVNRRAADNRSPALDLTTSYAPYHYCLATDPETAAPWTIANVNALQSGVEVV